MRVWNPANFSVNYANTAGSAGSASTATTASTANALNTGNSYSVVSLAASGTTINSSGITFPNSTVQTTAATTPGTTFNSVGSYTWAGLADAAIYAGSTYAGGSCIYFGLAWDRGEGLNQYIYWNGSVLSGTWRAMVTCTADPQGLGGFNTSGGLMVRIA
jgi:hypothetical protein